MMDLLHTLNKTNKEIEQFVYLFEECNLNCSFCWQDHGSKLGQDAIFDRISDIFNTIKKYPNQPHQINIMGGELFHDGISDALFEEYFRMVSAVYLHAQVVSVPISFTFVTNLVFEKIDRVLNLIDRLSVMGVQVALTTSYDPVGRFNAVNRKIFFTNLNYIMETAPSTISNVSVVMTKPNISYLLSKEDEDLRWIYSHFNLYFDYYSPNQSANFHTPKESELLEFFRWAAKEYPNAGPFTTWSKNTVNTTSCRRSEIIGPNGNQGRCCSLLDNFPKHDKKLIPIFNITNNNDLEAFYMNQKGCMSCEYLSKCTMGCFLIHTHELCNDMGSECIYKIIFKEHPEWPI